MRPARNRLACVSVAVVGVLVSFAACSSGGGGGEGPGGADAATSTAHPPLDLDAIHAALTAGLDQPLVFPEAELDQDFPIVEQLSAPEWPGDRDPTKGLAADCVDAFDAFVPTESADDHFTIDKIDPGVPAALVERVKKGVLFGMKNFDDFMPGFSLTAATSKKAGGKPFYVSILTSADTKWKLGYRPYVEWCGGGTAEPETIEDLADDIQRDTCIPRIFLREASPTATSFSPSLFYHELVHVAEAYYTQSSPYLDRGGMKMAMGLYDGFIWQAESVAQFVQRHAPDWSAYDFTSSCPFEPLRRGAFSWSKTSAVGTDASLPYETALLVDQLTWHRFGRDPKWIYDWLLAEVDPRTVATPPKRPYKAGRRLLRVISSMPGKTDLSALNVALLESGIDLYARGLDPWTARNLLDNCVRPGPSVALPLFSFDTIRVEIGSLAPGDKLHLSLDVDRDPTFVRALVAAVDLDPGGTPKPQFMTCIDGLPVSEYGKPSPRDSCMRWIHPLTALHVGNDHQDDVKLDSTLYPLDRFAIVAVVFHLPMRTDALRTPINVTLHADKIFTAPARTVTKDQCGDLTNDYRSRCKTSDCYCIGNSYCEGAVDPPPSSCEKAHDDCYLFCAFQKETCDCASFCDLFSSRLGCP